MAFSKALITAIGKAKLNHRDLKFERTAQGELVIVTPVGGEGGSREADLIGELVYWNRRTQLGNCQVLYSSFLFCGIER